MTRRDKMSGGHFDYQQHHLYWMAEEIDELIELNNCTDKNEYDTEIGRHYPDDIITKFKETAYELKRTAAMVHRIDWLLSGDDDEGSFRKRWDKEVPPAKDEEK